jgi:septum formation protein
VATITPDRLTRHEMILSMTPRLILASASPRRKQLLAEAGYAFEVIPSEIDEPEPGPGIDPSWYVMNLSWRKAAAVARQRREGLVLGADTIAAVDASILNKPVDRIDAERMIRLQEGRDTDVLTGVCLFDAARWEWVGTVQTSIVRFRALDDHERDVFLDSRKWEGKAGAYGVQDGDPFVSVVRGSLSNVVGLPMEWLETVLSPDLRLADRANSRTM